jgi:predicted GNAT superfamily acetyltransferase
LPARPGKLRPATPADLPAILALNEESVKFLSPLTAERLEQLHVAAALHCVVAGEVGVTAFLLAFREGVDYDSVNYRWFAQRYARFLYIDRVVVAPGARGGGVASMLYEHAFRQAAASAVPILACEFDIEPPNPVSARFHAKFGFSEVGRHKAGSGSKRVSLQVAEALPGAQIAPR